MKLCLLKLAAASSYWVSSVRGFSVMQKRHHQQQATIFSNAQLHASTSTSTATTSSSSADTPMNLERNVAQLKKVLEREYVSFFNPMERDYYSPTVTFDDPMTSLAGVDSYQNNVDMLASRTLLGKLLFDDAGIVLHSVTGGDIMPSEDEGQQQISNIITRWTLRVTAKILPWQPTARFSGISVYEVVPGGPKGVMISHQTDYWDSINIKKTAEDGGSAPEQKYEPVSKSIAIQDFLNQLKPSNFAAPPAGVELPYQLLRRGNGYEVRRYPSYSAVQIPYDRRDEAYDRLASLTKNIVEPLAPAIVDVVKKKKNGGAATVKQMTWPLEFASPGQDHPSEPFELKQKLEQQQNDAQVRVAPSKVVAVKRFKDASVEPVVRKADYELRQCLQRDGLQASQTKTSDDEDTTVRFAQYDAIYSMGERRGEVWIDLEDGGHPW